MARGTEGALGTALLGAVSSSRGGAGLLLWPPDPSFSQGDLARRPKSSPVSSTTRPFQRSLGLERWALPCVAIISSSLMAARGVLGASQHLPPTQHPDAPARADRWGTRATNKPDITPQRVQKRPQARDPQGDPHWAPPAPTLAPRALLHGDGRRKFSEWSSGHPRRPGHPGCVWMRGTHSPGPQQSCGSINLHSSEAAGDIYQPASIRTTAGKFCIPSVGGREPSN